MAFPYADCIPQILGSTGMAESACEPYRWLIHQAVSDRCWRAVI